MRHGKRTGYVWIIGAWLFCAVLAFSVTAMIQAGHVNLFRFYDVGEICDIVCNDEGINAEGLLFDPASNSYQAQGDTASKSYLVQKKDNVFRYAYVKVRLFQADRLDIALIGYDSAANESYRCEYSLTEGDNYLSVGGHEIETCSFLIENQPGKTFAIDRLRFYEKEIAVWGKQAWLRAGLLWLLFFSVSLLLRAALLLKRKKGRRPSGFCRLVSFWQDLFLFCGLKACGICRGRSRRQVRLIRAGLFLMLIWGGYYFFMTELYLKNMNYVYMFAGVLFALLAVFCLEKEPKKLAWNRTIVFLWVVIWTMSVISDLITGKSQGAYLGLVMLGPFSFFLFAWHNMERPERLLDDFMDAVEVSAWLRIFLALAFDSYRPGERYLGIDGNPGICAMFLLVALVLFASRIERLLGRESLSARYFVYLAGTGILLQLFWHTQSVTGLAALSLLFLFYLGRLHLKRKFVWKKKRWLLMVFSVFAVLLSFFVMQEVMSRKLEPAASFAQGEEAGETRLPSSFAQGEEAGKAREASSFAGRAEFPERETDLFSEPVYAGSLITQSRIYQKLTNATSLETLTTGRNLYWGEFLRSMNLFGNKSKPYFWRGRHMAHNAVLGMGNQYGAFIMVPYAMFLILTLCKAARKAGMRSSHRAVFVFGCLAGGIVTAMGDNVEQPFLLPLWLATYICAGSLFPSKYSESGGVRSR